MKNILSALSFKWLTFKVGTIGAITVLVVLLVLEHLNVRHQLEPFQIQIEDARAQKKMAELQAAYVARHPELARQAQTPAEVRGQKSEVSPGSVAPSAATATPAATPTPVPTPTAEPSMTPTPTPYQ